MRDRWYSVEEKLPPEEVEDYMITTDYGDIAIAHWTNHGFFRDSTTQWRWTGYPQYSKVIAWRPLPEAYVPVEKGDNNE
jgi:hypothetical protein